MEDYIDRQVAIDAMKQYAHYDDFDVSVVDEDIAIIALKDLPSADVQPVRHGRWIEEPNCMYRCSSCGSHYPSIRGYMDYCYCPSCGASMDGE